MSLEDVKKSEHVLVCDLAKSFSSQTKFILKLYIKSISVKSKTGILHFRILVVRFLEDVKGRERNSLTYSS